MPNQYFQINRYNRDGTLVQSFSVDSLNYRTSLSYYDSKGKIWRLDSLFYQDDILTEFQSYSISTGEQMLKASVTLSDSMASYKWYDGENEYLGSICEDNMGVVLELYDAENRSVWRRIDSTLSISFNFKTDDNTRTHQLKNGHYFSYTLDSLGLMQAIQETDINGVKIFSSTFYYVDNRVIEKRHVFPNIYFDVNQPSIQRKTQGVQLLEANDVFVNMKIAKQYAYQEFYKNTTLSSKKITVEDQYLPDGKTLFRRRYLNKEDLLMKETFYAFSANGQNDITYYYDNQSRIIQIYAPHTTGNIKYYRTFYDNNNHPIRKETLDSKKHVIGAVRYSYDMFSKLAFIEKVNMLGQTTEIQEVYGIPHSKIIRKREASGQLIADEYLDIHENITKTVFYNYIDDMIFADYYSVKQGLFKQRRYSLDGAIDHRLYLNSAEQILKEEFYSPQKELLKEREYQIENALVQEINYDPYGRFMQKTVIQYNKNGDPLSKKTMDETGKLLEVQSFSYNANGVDLRQMYSGDGVVVFSVSTDYDTLGNKQFETWTDAEGLMYRKVIFQYDDRMRLEREIYMSPYTSKPEIYEYKYGVTGHLIIKEHYENDILTEKIHYRYYPKQKMRMLEYKLVNGTITRKEIENL